MQGLEDMTRARDGLQRVPLMNGIGAAQFVNDIASDEMDAAANRLLQYAAAHGDAAAVQAVQRNETFVAVMSNVVALSTSSSGAAAKSVEKAVGQASVSVVMGVNVEQGD